jgi:hypothetical protein
MIILPGSGFDNDPGKIHDGKKRCDVSPLKKRRISSKLLRNKNF